MEKMFTSRPECPRIRPAASWSCHWAGWCCVSVWQSCRPSPGSSHTLSWRRLWPWMPSGLRPSYSGPDTWIGSSWKVREVRKCKTNQHGSNRAFLRTGSVSLTRHHCRTQCVTVNADLVFIQSMLFRACSKTQQNKDKSTGLAAFPESTSCSLVCVWVCLCVCVLQTLLAISHTYSLIPVTRVSESTTRHQWEA